MATLRKREMDDALERGFGFTLVPSPLDAFSSAALRTENHLVLPEGFQTLRLVESEAQDTESAMRTNLEGLEGDFFWAYTVPDTVVPDTVVMAGRPEWNGDLFEDSDRNGPSLKGSYDHIYYIWTDSSGNPRPQATADSLAALYDKRNFYDVGFSIWADQTKLNDIDIDSNTVIAYAELYIRDTLEQPRPGDSCICTILRPIGQFDITKADYLEVSNPEHPSYHLAKENGNKDYFEFDTLMDLRQYFPVILPYWGWGVDPKSSDPWVDSCNSIIQTRRALPDTHALHYPAGTYLAKGEDRANFSWRFFTTRVVPVSFLRGSLAHHLYGAIRRGEAEFRLCQNRCNALLRCTPRQPGTSIGRGRRTKQPNLPNNGIALR